MYYLDMLANSTETEISHLTEIKFTATNAITTTK